MLLTAPAGASFNATLPDEEATRRFVADIAAALEPGDLVTLSGDLGAGKTTFARALIRHLAGDETIEVPSPTFTLIQNYDLPRFPLVHADLYRMLGRGRACRTRLRRSARRLGRADGMAGSRRRLPAAGSARHHVHAGAATRPDVRNVRYVGYGNFAQRAERIAMVRSFLDRSRLRHGGAPAHAGRRLDTDLRAPEPRRRAGDPDERAAPSRRPAGARRQALQRHRPSRRGHRALCRWLAAALRAQGFSAPAIMHADLDHGLLVMEDLGVDRVVTDDPPAPIAARYAAAVDLLAALHGRSLPETLSVAPHLDYRLPRYELTTFSIEAELLIDSVSDRAGSKESDAMRKEFVALWSKALKPALDAPATWVLRDYHSPNLLWLEDRGDVARIGVLDLQDALLGPAAYDRRLAAAGRRALDVPEAAGNDAARPICPRPHEPNRRTGTAIRYREFHAALCDARGAARRPRSSAIFARLERRDGKPQYLRHMPRLWNYLQRSLAHPALAPLKTGMPSMSPLRMGYDVAKHVQGRADETMMPKSAMVSAAGSARGCVPIAAIPKAPGRGRRQVR